MHFYTIYHKDKLSYILLEFSVCTVVVTTFRILGYILQVNGLQLLLS